MREAIEGRLKTLNPVFFDFQDDSHLHAGHSGNKGGGHYTVVVVSEAFGGVSRLNRQRTIKTLLHDLYSRIEHQSGHSGRILPLITDILDITRENHEEKTSHLYADDCSGFRQSFCPNLSYS